MSAKSKMEKDWMLDLLMKMDTVKVCRTEFIYVEVKISCGFAEKCH
jgi:hypothetical protein